MCTLLDQVKDPVLRDWYADRDVHVPGVAPDNGWTRPALEHHVATGLHRRVGAAPNNFTQAAGPSRRGPGAGDRQRPLDDAVRETAVLPFGASQLAGRGHRG